MQTIRFGRLAMLLLERRRIMFLHTELVSAGVIIYFRGQHATLEPRGSKCKPRYYC